MAKNRTIDNRDNYIQIELSKLKRTQQEGKANQPSTILKSNQAITYFTVPTNGYAYMSFTVASVKTPPYVLLGVPQLGLWLSPNAAIGDLVDANHYPGGANWTSSLLAGVEMISWFDWPTSDGSNLVVQIMVHNDNVSSVKLAILSEWRLLNPIT